MNVERFHSECLEDTQSGLLARYRGGVIKIARWRPQVKNSRILETPTLSTNEDSRTDTILEKLRNFF